MEKLAESADNIYKRLQTITGLPDVNLDTALPPSLIGVADQKANTAAMWQELLSHSQVRGVASAAVGAVDVAQVSTRYTTREEAEALRRERDAQLQKQIDAQLAKTRMEIASARIQGNVPAERLPVTQVVLPGTPQTETAAVRELMTELDAQGKRIEVLEGNDAAHYFASRM